MIIYTATSIPADKPSPFLLLENEVLHPRAQQEQGAAEGASGGLLGFCSQAQASGFPRVHPCLPSLFCIPFPHRAVFPESREGSCDFLSTIFMPGGGTLLFLSVASFQGSLSPDVSRGLKVSSSAPVSSVSGHAAIDTSDFLKFHAEVS